MPDRKSFSMNAFCAPRLTQPMMMISAGFAPCADTDTAATVAAIPARKKQITLRTCLPPEPREQPKNQEHNEPPSEWQVRRILVRRRPCGDPAGLENRQVDGIGHRFVPGVVRVHVIPRVEFRAHLSRGGGISQERIEVDDGVVGLAGPNPLVDGLTGRFALLTEVVRDGYPLER